jgi:uncharacterized protein (DUF2267 family)
MTAGSEEKSAIAINGSQRHVAAAPRLLSRPLPRRLPPDQSRQGSPSGPVPVERRDLQEDVGLVKPSAAPQPTGLQRRATSHREFISLVQAEGRPMTARQAERGATAVLGELLGCVSWPVGQSLAACLPRPVRQLRSLRSFESSMSRFSPQAFLRGVARQERVEMNRATDDTRAVLLALDQTMPGFLAGQLHGELASLWGPLTAHQKNVAADAARTTNLSTVGE